MDASGTLKRWFGLLPHEGDRPFIQWMASVIDWLMGILKVNQLYLPICPGLWSSPTPSVWCPVPSWDSESKKVICLRKGWCLRTRLQVKVSNTCSDFLLLNGVTKDSNHALYITKTNTKKLEGRILNVFTIAKMVNIWGYRYTYIDLNIV